MIHCTGQVKKTWDPELVFSCRHCVGDGELAGIEDGEDVEDGEDGKDGEGIWDDVVTGIAIREFGFRNETKKLQVRWLGWLPMKRSQCGGDQIMKIKYVFSENPALDIRFHS